MANTMAGSSRLHRALTLVATAALAAAAACSGSTSSPPADPAAAPSPPAAAGPITVYTLDRPEHRVPVPIIWHADSRSFFVGTWHDGTLYRGSIDDPTVRVFLEGQPGQAISGLAIADGLLYVAGGMYHPDLRPRDADPGSAPLAPARTGTSSTSSSPTRAMSG